MFQGQGRLWVPVVLLKKLLTSCFLHAAVSKAENSYLLHVGKCLVQANGHYCHLEALINTLSLVTQELSCNRRGCSAVL